MQKKINSITTDGKKAFSKVEYSDGSVNYFKLTLAECCRRMEKMGFKIAHSK